MTRRQWTVLLRAYDKAMGGLTERYPEDYEAWVFYALTLQASAPKDDRTYANQLEAAAILEKLLPQNPEHPGVVHFLIHAYDYPSLAEKGIAAAKRYASIAPAAPHARHMPSHIYSMVGLWEDSIASNQSARSILPGYVHASDFIVYAHLQLAQDGKAKAAVEEALHAVRSNAPGPAVAFGEDNREQAVKLMRAATDLEDARVKHVAMENELYPMRELLGELLLEAGQAPAALREFEASLKATPNRYRGLWGAARAADAAGDRQKAAGYFAKVVELTRNADTARPEIALARAQLAQR